MNATIEQVAPGLFLLTVNRPGRPARLRVGTSFRELHLLAVRYLDRYSPARTRLAEFHAVERAARLARQVC